MLRFTVPFLVALGIFLNSSPPRAHDSSDENFEESTEFVKNLDDALLSFGDSVRAFLQGDGHNETEDESLKN